MVVHENYGPGFNDKDQEQSCHFGGRLLQVIQRNADCLTPTASPDLLALEMKAQLRRVAPWRNVVRSGEG
jgi:hypothetical protein